MAEGFVQVAPDSTGKKVDMDQVLQSDTGTVYRQKAEIVGEAGEAILEMRDLMKTQIAVLRGILFALSNGEITEEEFLDP